jgi:hypothetical protein
MVELKFVQVKRATHELDYLSMMSREPKAMEV